MSRAESQELGVLASAGPSSNAPQPAEPQNSGGMAAWLKILGCFFVFMNTWGLASSFGVYQAYYEANTLSSYSPSAISWIGTLQVFLLGFTGIFAGPLYDRGYVQALLGIGFLLVTLGLFMLSLSTSYYEVLLSQGICIGIGM
jgi:hypothetical protein